MVFLLPPARRTIVSGAEGVPTSASLGKRMVNLPLTARSEDTGYCSAPILAPAPREKPKNHNIFVRGVLGDVCASFGRSLLMRTHPQPCWAEACAWNGCVPLSLRSAVDPSEHSEHVREQAREPARSQASQAQASQGQESQAQVG